MLVQLALQKVAVQVRESSSACHPLHYLIIEPPQNVNLRTISSGALRITWDPPPRQNSILETFYIVYFQGKRYRIEATGDLELNLTSDTIHIIQLLCGCEYHIWSFTPSCTSQTTLEWSMLSIHITPSNVNSAAPR